MDEIEKIGNAWTKQKELQKQDLPSLAEVTRIARNIKELRVRALFVCLYLTGGRISEICNAKLTRIINRKTRETKVFEFDGLRKQDIEQGIKNNIKVLLFKLRNLKNRKTKSKTLPVPVERERELVEMLNEYLDLLEPEDILFDFSRQRAWQLLDEEVVWNPHWFRHLRTTHLIKYYDFSDQLLVRWTGWTNSQPAQGYLEFRWGDFTDKFK